jgi:hypothetical protein
MAQMQRPARTGQCEQQSSEGRRDDSAFSRNDQVAPESGHGNLAGDAVPIRVIRDESCWHGFARTDYKVMRLRSARAMRRALIRQRQRQRQRKGVK